MALGPLDAAAAAASAAAAEEEEEEGEAGEAEEEEEEEEEVAEAGKVAKQFLQKNLPSFCEQLLSESRKQRFKSHHNTPHTNNE